MVEGGRSWDLEGILRLKTWRAEVVLWPGRNVTGLNDYQVEPEGKEKPSEYNIQCVFQAWPVTDWGVQELLTWLIGTKMASLTEEGCVIYFLAERKVQVRSISRLWLVRLQVPSASHNVCWEVKWYRLWSLCQFSRATWWRSCEGMRCIYRRGGGWAVEKGTHWQNRELQWIIHLLKDNDSRKELHISQMPEEYDSWEPEVEGIL